MGTISCRLRHLRNIGEYTNNASERRKESSGHGCWKRSTQHVQDRKEPQADTHTKWRNSGCQCDDDHFYESRVVMRGRADEFGKSLQRRRQIAITSLGGGRVARLRSLSRSGGSRPSVILLYNATPSVFHQRHIGRLLRSSSNKTGRRVASPLGREAGPGRRPPLWPGDLRNDGGSVSAGDAAGSEA